MLIWDKYPCVEYMTHTHTVQKEDKEVELVWQNPPAIADETVGKWMGIHSHCKN